MGEVREFEWDYFPVPDGEPFTDKDGHEVLGWHDRSEGQDDGALCAAFETYYTGLCGQHHSLIMRPILARTATDIECRINGWEEGTFVRCTPRAKRSWPMWQIELAAFECTACDDTGNVSAECRKPRSRCSCGLDGASEDGCPTGCPAQQRLYGPTKEKGGGEG